MNFVGFPDALSGFPGTQYHDMIAAYICGRSWASVKRIRFLIKKGRKTFEIVSVLSSIKKKPGGDRGL